VKCFISLPFIFNEYLYLPPPFTATTTTSYQPPFLKRFVLFSFLFFSNHFDVFFLIYLGRARALASVGRRSITAPFFYDHSHETRRQSHRPPSTPTPPFNYGVVWPCLGLWLAFWTSSNRRQPPGNAFNFHLNARNCSCFNHTRHRRRSVREQCRKQWGGRKQRQRWRWR
jgi:hypothetical protein